MKKIFVILFAGLLVPAGLSAQKVYKDASNRVILDLTVAAGMPAGAITSTSKINSTGSAADNDKVFEKLEIAPSDLGTRGWASAIADCKNVGTGWRLPTQRELMLIWIFMEALKDNGIATLLSDWYRSATESGSSESWVMYGSDGNMLSTSRYTAYYVRCVREVN